MKRKYGLREKCFSFFHSELHSCAPFCSSWDPSAFISCRSGVITGFQQEFLLKAPINQICGLIIMQKKPETSTNTVASYWACHSKSLKVNEHNAMLSAPLSRNATLGFWHEGSLSCKHMHLNHYIHASWLMVDRAMISSTLKYRWKYMHSGCS